MKNQQKVELYRVLQTCFLHSFTQLNIAPKRFELQSCAWWHMKEKTKSFQKNIDFISLTISIVS